MKKSGHFGIVKQQDLKRIIQGKPVKYQFMLQTSYLLASLWYEEGRVWVILIALGVGGGEVSHLIVALSSRPSSSTTAICGRERLHWEQMSFSRKFQHTLHKVVKWTEACMDWSAIFGANCKDSYFWNKLWGKTKCLSIACMYPKEERWQLENKLIAFMTNRLIQ